VLCYNLSMSKNIVLIGFMGVGKSLAAKHLAAKLARPILSTDELVVTQEGKSIAQIFHDHGEEYFRQVEASVIESLVDQKDLIIDCGGGIALNPRNIEILKKNGIVFYLSATADEIYKNVKDQKHRPLLNTPDPKNKIAELLAKRRPFYEQADYVIDADGKTGEQLCVDILTLFKKTCAK
jgi:shikimate kinase